MKRPAWTRGGAAAVGRPRRRGSERDRFSRAARALVVLALLGLASLAAGARQDSPASGAAGEGKSLEEASILGPPQGRALAGAELDSRTRALGDRMRCPVCQGLSIADSPSASAFAMMSQVRDLLARGYTEDQVLDYFVRSYGEFVLLQPTAKGFNLMVWLLPVAGILAGALLIVLRLRASRARRGGDQQPGAGGDAADRDLDRYVERVRSEVGP